MKATICDLCKRTDSDCRYVAKKTRKLWRKDVFWADANWIKLDICDDCWYEIEKKIKEVVK